MLQEGHYPRGGRLAFFAERWPGDYYRSVLKKGLRISWLRGPPPRMDHGEYSPKSTQEGEVLLQEHKDLLEKRAVELASELHCVLTQFCIQKKGSSSMRPILNMKVLSPFIDSPHFKMEGIKATKDLLRKNDWLCRIDLKDAYLHVKLHKQDRKYVQYRHQGRVYQWRVLPFGYRDAPRFFQKLITDALANLRHKSALRFVIYLDDILVLAEEEGKCAASRDQLLQRLVNLGFAINLQKSSLAPTRTITFLGINIDTTNLVLSLPVEKLRSCRRLINKTLKRVSRGNKTSLLELQSLTGTLQSTSECMTQHRLRMNALFEDLNKARTSAEAQVTLSPEAVENLEWWRDNIAQWNGKAILTPSVDHEIAVDASDLGIGAVCLGSSERNDLTAHKFLPPSEHINCRELMAAEFGFKAFASQLAWTNCSVRVKTDNFVAAAYLNRMGGRIPYLCRVTERIHQFAFDRRITLSAEWIPGVDNKLADRLSRIQNNYSDKMLHPDLFSLIQTRFGKVQVDLFASEQTAQVPRYISYRAEERAWYVDVFSRPLPKGLSMYANPPFALMGRLLAKVRREAAELTLVAPVWTSQPWWPDLQSMMVETPLTLEREEGLFLLPQGYPPDKIQHPRWRMIACKVSGASC